MSLIFKIPLLNWSEKAPALRRFVVLLTFCNIQPSNTEKETPKERKSSFGKPKRLCYLLLVDTNILKPRSTLLAELRRQRGTPFGSQDCNERLHI